MGAHRGRCFRAWRGTLRRKTRQGVVWEFPIRRKVPLALRSFLIGDDRQVRAGADSMQLAIMRYAEHRQKVSAPIRKAARGR